MDKADNDIVPDHLKVKKKKRGRKDRDLILDDAISPSLNVVHKEKRPEIKNYDKSAFKARLEKYSRGEGMNMGNPGIKHKVLQKKYMDKEKDIRYSEVIASKTEVLLGENPGFIETEEGDFTRKLSQRDIKNSVDITSASKQFELDLSFGPYRLNYTKNGRFLLLGGKQGHVAALDWVTKNLMTEINVMESVLDVQWFHIETMFAVAQKEWLYVYNNQGVELHCVQDISRPLRLEFLPYHFLLAASTESGWLKWLDVSIGKVVASYHSKRGRLGVMTQNPFNAILCTGHSNGTVAMWSPNLSKPVATLLCHKSIVQGITIDHSGNYMATSGCQKDMKIWDVRQMAGPLQSFTLLGGSANDLAFSHTGLLGTACGNTIQVYKNCTLGNVSDAYLIHRTKRPIHNIEFCPYEDVLGLATSSGFYSMLVPGAGEANFDALEANPMISKSQRREVEVRSLLDKIPIEMISLDPTVLMEVDMPKAKDKWEAQKKILFAKVPNINFTPRNKRKQGRSLRRDTVKRIIKEDAKKNFFNKIKDVKGKIVSDLTNTGKDTNVVKKKHVLDRFRYNRKKTTSNPTARKNKKKNKN